MSVSSRIRRSTPYGEENENSRRPHLSYFLTLRTVNVKGLRLPQHIKTGEEYSSCGLHANPIGTIKIELEVHQDYHPWLILPQRSRTVCCTMNQALELQACNTCEKDRMERLDTTVQLH